MTRVLLQVVKTRPEAAADCLAEFCLRFSLLPMMQLHQARQAARLINRSDKAQKPANCRGTAPAHAFDPPVPIRQAASVHCAHFFEHDAGQLPGGAIELHACWQGTGFKMGYLTVGG